MYSHGLWQVQGTKCNPASCVNPTACGIPACELVYYYGWWWDNKRYGTQSCATTAKQTGTGASDCIPAK